MKKGQIEVVGIKKTEKDGKVSFTLFGQTPFEDWENGQGLKTIQEWTRSDISSIPVGSIVYPVYTKGFQGKAVLQSVVIAKD